MSTSEGLHGGKETAVPAVGDQLQHSLGQISRLLGRPKCFSGREEEGQVWSLKFGAISATLSDCVDERCTSTYYRDHVGSTI